MARFGFVRLSTFVAIALSITMLSPVKAARVARIPKPPATAYWYAGRVYDRYFSVASLPRAVRNVSVAPRDARLRALGAAPYGIIDLTPIAGNAILQGPEEGLGFPTAVDNAGRIPYYNTCACAGIDNNIAIEINDSGTFSTVLYEDDSTEGAADAVPSGVSPNGYIAGELSTYYGGGGGFEQVIAWSPAGGVGYRSQASDRTYGLGINDAGVAVGSDTGTKGSFAARFSINARGAVGRQLLAPPKNTSWIGVATGINDAGTIVGYALFPGSSNGRAVRFSTTGPATVLPVAPAGVSSAAQAINAKGHIVGSAGSQAFLYRSNRVAYLPRPTGETAGNAVAYAINASDEIVGDIATSTTSTSAFLYVGGQSYDLNALLPQNSGWQIVHAAGINDSGQIVGMGYFAGEGGGLTAFSMKPTPATNASLLR